MYLYFKFYVPQYDLKSLSFILVLVLFSGLSFGQNDEKELEKEFYRLHDTTVYFQSTNLQLSQVYVDSCLAVAQSMESPYFYGKALQLKTRGEFFEGEVDSSIIYGNQSLDILKSFPDSLEFFMAEYNQGNLFLYKEDNIQALVQFRKAARIIDENFEIYVKIDRNQIILNRAYCYASIGLVLMNLEDYPGSLKSFKRALKTASRLDTWDSEILRSVILSNMGSVYYLMDNFEMAEKYAIASMEQKKKLGQDGSIGYSFQVLADAAYGRGKFRLCLKYLDQADKKFEILNNTQEINRNQFSRAKCYLKQNKSDLAIETLEGLEEIFLRDFTKTEQAQFYETLAEAHQQSGNLKNANDYFRITLKIRKDLDVKNDKKIVKEFIDFYEKEEQQLNQKVESLKHQQEKEKLELQIEGENEKKVWIYTLFLVSILCLVLVIMVISNAYRRNRKTTKDLSDSIAENKILFKEVHHRVKNNFQIISSLLNLQHGIEEDERGKKVLTDAQGRIQSMSLVHEMLYRKNEVKRIHFESYAQELVDSILFSFTQDERKIEFEINTTGESYDLEIAVPLGLILNEAITNAVKYAFDEDQEDASIHIELRKIDIGEFKLIIKDNGKGIPEEFIDGSKETLGVELINILSEQLGGQAQFRNENGALIVITFKI